MSATQIDTFCSTIARAAEAQLFGTASGGTIWFLLEYTGPWGRDAFAESDLPEAVKAHFNAAQDALPDARLHVIKQDPPYDLPNITVVIAISREIDPALYEFEFNECDDVTTLDLVDVVQNEAAYQEHRVNEPLVLVCTNAKRDRCCAVRGLPIYSQLVELMGTVVWRSSHLGGHRYAATGVMLPHGIMYGRMDDVEPTEIASAIVENRICLPIWRGRTYYPAEAQAAEYFLREESRVYDIDAYRLVGIELTGENQWDVHFEDVQGRMLHVIGVSRMQSETMIIGSCGKPPEPAVEHHLMYHRVMVLEG